MHMDEFVLDTDREGRLGWRDAHGRALALFVFDVAGVLRNPGTFSLHVGARAAELLNAP